MSASINDINYDEIEELISNEKEINTDREVTTKSSSCITQVQNISLSREKFSANIEENQSNNKTKTTVLSVKTSNIPGPVGLLPILVRLDFY